MNYEPLWKILEELIVELTKKGISIPTELKDDLKSAKTFIKIYRMEPTALDIITQIEVFLEKIEANLLYLARSDIGEAYANEYLQRIYDARLKGKDDETPVPSTFVTGVPRGDHWIRLAPNILNENELKELVHTFHLAMKPQEDGYLLIHGTTENVKQFIKKIGDKIRT